MKSIASKCTKYYLPYDNYQDYEIILRTYLITCVELDHPDDIIHNNTNLFSLSNALLTIKKID